MNDQIQETDQQNEKLLDQIRLQLALFERAFGAAVRAVNSEPRILSALEVEMMKELDDIARTHPEAVDLAEAYFAKLLAPRVR
ncbi:hypothetical protein HYE54_03500 [Aggregatibacter actinomycetemcomitans]|uniref:hypothetical protein n=1 Tax=Aggregatibacter actinomycetemcomitans TaxID=714 RepID=UPI00197C7D11|nr:hypothetical protein [Aggregatibacter actinomycetemcomitans]MBN6067851.1 hypothetical protein [Aggregatibacter actinomycetemcomitans]MBN6085788.1 hypothetical protein [Aggregatibacter actinomycetemcomitans]